MRTKTVAIVGCGKLANIVVQAKAKGLLTDYEIIGTYSRTFDNAKLLAENVNSVSKAHCTACHTIDELFALKPDYIVETASPTSLREIALPALKNGSSIVTLSIGALADADFYNQVAQTAMEYGTRVHLASGAIGGFDVLRTVSLMEASQVTFETKKGPNSLKNTDVYHEDLQNEAREVFNGNAIDAIALFPTRVNVAVAAALASTGPENINVSINSQPEFVGDKHRIEIESDQIHAVIDGSSKTAQIAGWSIVNTLRNITSPIAF
ncbi:MAG: aspartate dehydrogenase domain-containing protein [Sphingobacterium sp.]